MKPFKVSEKYRIARDEKSFVLQKYCGKRKNGEERWEAEGWYVKLEHVLEAVMRLEILESEDELPEAIRDAVALVRSLNDELRQSFVFEIPDPQQPDSEKHLVLKL